MNHKLDLLTSASGVTSNEGKLIGDGLFYLINCYIP